MNEEQYFSLEELQKELFSTRGVEYKITGLADRVHNQSFMDGEVAITRDEPLWIIHKPLAKTCDRLERISMNEITNSSFICPKCDLYNVEKVEKKIFNALSNLGIEYEMNVELDDVNETVRFYLSDFRTALIYHSSRNQKPNFADIIDSEMEKMERISESEYVDNVIFFTSEHVSNMEELIADTLNQLE